MNAKTLLACVVLVQCIYGLPAAPFLRTPLANAEFSYTSPYNAAAFGFANEPFEYGCGTFTNAFGYEGRFGYGTAFESNRLAGPFNAPFAFMGFAGPYANGPNFNGPFAYEAFSGPLNYGPFPYTAAIF